MARVRLAVKEDCKDIMRMIRELAKYEKASENIKLTEESQLDLYYSNAYIGVMCNAKPSLKAPRWPLFCSVAMLKEDGFTDNPLYKCLVAELPTGQKSKDGFTIVGHALFVFTYSSWKGRIIYLEDIYVMPEFRGHGIGKKFLQRIAKIGVDSKCSAIQLAVLNWNDTAINFYHAQGATDLTNETGYLVFRFEEEATRKLALDDDGK